MSIEAAHLSDEQILLELEGEVSGRRQTAIRSHLDACPRCRTRRYELETAMAGLIRVHRRIEGRRIEGAALPSAAASRARLERRMAEASANSFRFPSLSPILRWDRALAAAALGIAALGLWLAQSVSPRRQTADAAFVFTPDSRLTPGATTLASAQAVCAQANTKNKDVPPAVRMRVFAEYGIADAKPQAYEVDYLVTPALGGADDLRNLWPHSYAAVWNARVKDALEDRLRDMVCSGNLDLTQAQREIAGNWIAAYKKYFHTDKPLEEP